jgi:ssDNA-binding replication factor A large subunit
LFDVCSICGDKLIQNKCQEHGEVEPSKALVISCVVDDSTSSIRAVFFRELAERIITTQVSELASLDSEKRYELIKERLLGKELILIGKVKKNKIFNRLELIVNEVKDLNALEESKKLVEALELKVS